jgi:hypothetical protein
MEKSVDPSVKGSLLVGAVISMRRHLKQGRISAPQAAVRLSPVALELLEQKIDLGRWYPVKAFCEILELDWEIGGRRDPAYMRSAGEKSADHLFDTRIYQQLQYAERNDRVRSREQMLLQAKLISSITGSLYNFLQFEVRLSPENPDVLEILYGNAGPFAEALRLSTEGFMNQINKRQGSSRTWTSERLRPDLVAFRLSLPERLAENA